MIEDLSNRTDEELAAEAARESSDGPAFVAMVERFRQRVWRICYRLLCNEQDAADAAQEVFLRLFCTAAVRRPVEVRHLGPRRGTADLPGHAAEPRAPAAARERRGGARMGVPPAGPADAPPGLAMDLMQMLETLDEEDRAMLILKYAEGYDYEELAAIFELSVSACKMRISRAREKLQQRYPEPQGLPQPCEDFLEQLAELEVPAAAAGIRPQAAPAVEPLAVDPARARAGGGAPWAMVHFLRGRWGP